MMSYKLIKLNNFVLKNRGRFRKQDQDKGLWSSVQTKEIHEIGE
jgi:hypothetical protein